MGTGLGAALAGIGFVIGTPAVWRYALVPVVVFLVLIVALGGLGIWGASWAGDALLGKPAGHWEAAGGWLVTLVLTLAALFLAFILALALTQPLSGFALEALSLAQEEALTGRSRVPPSLLAGLYISVRVALVTLVLGGGLFVACFLVDLVFPPALVVTVPLRFLLAGWLLAWDFCDYPLGLRGLGLRARLRWARSHRAAFTAFGLFWAALLLIPGTFLLLLPLGVAGATRLVVATEQAGTFRTVPPS